MSLEEQVREAGKNYRKLKGVEATFHERQYDSSARIALGELVHSITPEEQANLAIGASNDVVDQYIGRYNEITKTRLNEIVEGNFAEVLKFLDKEKLMMLMFSAKPYKTGNDEHDRIADMHERFLKMQEAIKNKDFSEYLALLKDENAKQALAYRISAQPERVLQNMAAYSAELQKQLLEEVKNKEESYLRGYIKSNYNKSEEDEKKEINITAGALAGEEKK